MKYVLGIDAGKSTGLAILRWSEGGPGEVVARYQKQETIEELVRVVVRAANDYPLEAIVIEQFDLRPNNKFVADLTTVKINAVIEYVLKHEHNQNIVYQTPAQAKGLVTDKALKNLGLWVTGAQLDAPDADDARDAMRHAVHYIVTTGQHLPTIKKGWPNG